MYRLRVSLNGTWRSISARCGPIHRQDRAWQPFRRGMTESIAEKLTAFDIADDGSLSNRRTWADGVGADGICLDDEGAIWAQSGP